MRYKKWQILVFLCCVTMLFSSCVRNYFDQQTYEEIVQDESPVPNVDSNHDWMMATGKGLVVDLSGVANVKLVRIFTDNPALTEFAEVVGEAYPSGDSRFVMNIAYPSRFETLYAAAVDSEDYYTIVSFRPGSSTNVDFTNPIVKHEKMPYHYIYQTFTYLFEEEYPESGDYDYNDVVLRISMEHSGEREVRLNVQLAAVGGEKQMAAAIRLAGYKYDEVESVKTVDNASFNFGAEGEIPDQFCTLIESKDLLLRSNYDEAVLNLFEDAHWATGDKVLSDDGSILRKRYNVSYEKSEEYGTFFPREITYIITFKDAIEASSLSLYELDTFIIESYNDSFWEVHTHNYAKVKVFQKHDISDAHNLPWAFCVPYDTFCWPLHAVAIGYQVTSKKVTYGAYPYIGHSFGEWAANKTKCTDWYLYPDQYEIYK